MLLTSAKLQSATKSLSPGWWDGAFGACWLTAEASYDFLAQHGAGKLLKKNTFITIFFLLLFFLFLVLLELGWPWWQGTAQMGEWGVIFWRSRLNSLFPASTQKVSM